MKRSRSAWEGGAASTPVIASTKAFMADPRDHAETPLAAYQDIQAVLLSFASSLGVAPLRSLRLYDPYYCEGSASRHLAACGFPNVYNRNEDFYASAAYAGRAGALFDVVITNPPFSADHVERFLRWAVETTPARSWLALLPAYIARKPFFFALCEQLRARGAPLPLFVGPSGAAYSFSAPALQPDGASALLSAPAGRDAPQAVVPGKFQCVWFVWSPNEAALGAAAAAVLASGRAALSDDSRKLPQLALASRPAPSERRWRKKMAAAAAADENEGARAASCRRSGGGHRRGERGGTRRRGGGRSGSGSGSGRDSGDGRDSDGRAGASSSGGGRGAS